MIASLQGRVASIAGDTVVVEVGGVGIAVVVTPATMASLRPGETARLATSLVVREDSLTLFGFADDAERTAFELLQTASGVGPRLAQAVLAVHSPSAIRLAIATDDLAALTQVPGIGRKGAQRIVLELKDKVASLDGGAPITLPAQSSGWREQLRAALTGLGWSGREVDDALVAVGPEADAAAAIGDEPDVSALLRSALRGLSRA